MVGRFAFHAFIRASIVGFVQNRVYSSLLILILIFSIVAIAFYLFNKFTLHGIILDQDDNPIPDANCQMIISGTVGTMGTEDVTRTTTDTDGHFWFRAVKRAGYAFDKEGYYPYEDHGNVLQHQLQGFWNGNQLKNNLIVVHLHKMGMLTKLVRYDNADIFLNKTNVATGYDLYAFGPCRNFTDTRFIEPYDPSTTQPTLFLEVWSDPPYDMTKESLDGYQWHLRIAIPGGGFAPRANVLSFTAPSDGYQESMVFTYPGKASYPYVPNPQILLFYKSFKGIYGRLEITFGVASDQAHRKGGAVATVEFTHITVTETGSRNLESDDRSGN